MLFIISDVKMELAFLLDVNSKNFRSDQFDNVLNSVKSTYAAFIIGKDNTRIGIVTFSELPRTAVSLDQYTSRQSLDIVVDQTLMSPLTSPSLLGQGLAAVKRLFYGKSRPETPKILVVITGGKSRDEVIKPSAALKLLNTTIFCVGVGQNIDRTELENVASTPTSGHVIMAAISHRETAGQNLASRIKKGKAYKTLRPGLRKVRLDDLSHYFYFRHLALWRQILSHHPDFGFLLTNLVYFSMFMLMLEGLTNIIQFICTTYFL